MKKDKLADIALTAIDEGLNVLDFYDPNEPSAVGQNQINKQQAGTSQINEQVPSVNNYVEGN